MRISLRLKLESRHSILYHSDLALPRHDPPLISISKLIGSCVTLKFN
jgi:hypothetical protein